MEIYVQSCGLAPEHDYRWLKISEDGRQSIDIPPLLKEKINTKQGEKVYLTDLYESQYPSIVLAKDDSKLLLLVTALKAIERSKLYGRGVRNSVAFIGEYPKDEPVLRRIAANALEDWESFRHIIDKAVDFDKNEGFLVDIESINKYIENVTNEVGSRKFETPDPSIKIAKDSPDIKKKLTEELEKYLLPDWDGPLVIVTGNVSEEVLTQHFVWRSISERVQQDEGDNWKEIPTKEKTKKNSQTGTKYLILGILFLAIASIALLIILKLPPSTKLQPLQPPETKQLESKQSQLHQETLETQTRQIQATPQADTKQTQTQETFHRKT